MVTPISKIPKEIRGLWKAQYEPRERIIERKVGKGKLTKYNKMHYIKKMRLIDALQSEGYFN